MYGEILGLLTNLMFGIGFVLARNIREEASPIFQNAMRSIVSLACFTLICLFSGFILLIFQVSMQLWLILIGSITFMVIIGDSLALKSQSYLGPAKMLTITTISPFLTILLSIIFLNRPFSLTMLISGILISIGIIIINLKRVKMKKGDNQNHIESTEKKISKEFLIGTILAIIAAFSWSFGILLTDYSMNQIYIELNIGIISTIIALLIRYLFASIILGFVALKEEVKKSVHRTRRTWIFLLISALLSSTLGSIFFVESARTAGAAFLSLITTATPLFTIPFSYIINRERILKRELIGILIVLSGVLVILFF